MSLVVFYWFLLILLISTRFGDPRIRGPPSVRANEPVGGVGGTAALKIAIRLRRIEIGEKFKNIRNQRLRKLPSHQKKIDGKKIWRNRFFGVVRSGGFRPGREIPSPAGEISEQILEIRGGFPRFSKIKNIFEENIKKSRGFSIFWEPRAWIPFHFTFFIFISLIFYWFLLIFINSHQVRGPAD